jgi:putative ABC transport system substrate-binding protein
MIGALLTLIVTLTIGLLAVPLTIGAQPSAKIPRIGVFQPGGTGGSAAHLVEAFKLGMRERGYVEGQSVIFEHRFGEFRRERMSEAVAELVRLKVDVIVTSTDQGIAAVKQQTQTIPIVMANSTDPVGTGSS